MKSVLHHYILLLLMGLGSAVHAQAPEFTPRNWVVYYHHDLPADPFLPYDLVVFDSDKHPPLAPLRTAPRQILGYLSLGEAESYRADFAAIEKLGVLMEENPNWPGHFVVDIRSERWHHYILNSKIPQIIANGFDGLMFDTLDSVEALESGEHKEKYTGMIQASANLIHKIRLKYPQLKLMVNRGFATLPLIANDVDYVLAESVLVNHQPNKKTFRFFSESIYQEYVARLQSAQSQAPKLKVVTLDYWPPEDAAGLKAIYAKHRANGFIPYVATIALDRVVEEPK